MSSDNDDKPNWEEREKIREYVISEDNARALMNTADSLKNEVGLVDIEDLLVEIGYVTRRQVQRDDVQTIRYWRRRLMSEIRYALARDDWDWFVMAWCVRLHEPIKLENGRALPKNYYAILVAENKEQALARGFKIFTARDAKDKVGKKHLNKTNAYLRANGLAEMTEEDIREIGGHEGQGE